MMSSVGHKDELRKLLLISLGSVLDLASVDYRKGSLRKKKPENE